MPCLAAGIQRLLRLLSRALGTLMIAAILFVADFGFTNLFQWFGVLETEATP